MEPGLFFLYSLTFTLESSKSKQRKEDETETLWLSILVYSERINLGPKKNQHE